MFDQELAIDLEGQLVGGNGDEWTVEDGGEAEGAAGDALLPDDAGVTGEVEAALNGNDPGFLSEPRNPPDTSRAFGDSFLKGFDDDLIGYSSDEESLPPSPTKSGKRKSESTLISAPSKKRKMDAKQPVTNPSPPKSPSPSEAFVAQEASVIADD
jgi:hypothetical protein